MTTVKITPQKLHEKIRTLLRHKAEIVYADTHVLNISEEEETDKFSDVHYRVYHKNESCFDVMQVYDGWADDGGGDLVYKYFPDVWNGFENTKELPIEEAYSIVQSLLEKGKHYDLSTYQVEKGIKPKSPLKNEHIY